MRFNEFLTCRFGIPGSGAAKRLLDFLLMQKSDGVNLVNASSAAAAAAATATGRKEESREGEPTEQLNCPFDPRRLSLLLIFIYLGHPNLGCHVLALQTCPAYSDTLGTRVKVSL